MSISINQDTKEITVIRGIEDEKQEQPFYGFIINLIKRIQHLDQYRELIHSLVIRDLKVRYKNSILGVLWSLLNPLLMMIVFTVVFTVMAPVRSPDIHSYPVFVLCGLLPWHFFNSSVISATSSITLNAPLIKKVYFPIEALPLSVILANLINFLVSMLILFGMILLFQIPLTIWLLYLPIVILIQVIFTLGIGLLLSAINVFYRDIQQIVDVLMLAWFFVTPIFYPINILPRSYELFGLTLDIWRLSRIINPMASLIASYRVLLYHGAPPALDFLARTAITAMLVLLFGWLIFNHFCWRFAEEL